MKGLFRDAFDFNYTKLNSLTIEDITSIQFTKITDLVDLLIQNKIKHKFIHPTRHIKIENQMYKINYSGGHVGHKDKECYFITLDKVKEKGR